jgi:hypothetical protein
VQAAHHGPIVDSEMLAHPVTIIVKGAEAVQISATQDPDEEVVRGLQVRDGDADVVYGANAGQHRSLGHGHSL